METDTKLAHWSVLAVSMLGFAVLHSPLKGGEIAAQIFDYSMFAAGM
jgi:hypothetical protein